MILRKTKQLTQSRCTLERLASKKHNIKRRRKQRPQSLGGRYNFLSVKGNRRNSPYAWWHQTKKFHHQASLFSRQESRKEFSGENNRKVTDVWDKFSQTRLALHTAAEPAVPSAVKILVSYWNDTITAFFFAANKDKNSAQVPLAPTSS